MLAIKQLERIPLLLILAMVVLSAIKVEEKSMTEVVVINDLKHIELNNLTAVKQNCFLKLQHQFNTCHGDFEGTSILKTTGNVEKDNHRHRTIHQPSSLTGNSTRLHPKLRQLSLIDIEEDRSFSGGTLFALQNAYVTNNL